MSKEEENFDYQCKLIVVGESGVGKTCIISRFVNDIFNEEEQVTLGAYCLEKKITSKSGDIIKLFLWDTIGQEVFRSINQGYFKGSNLVMLIYDVTNYNSFKSIQSYWYNAVKDKVNSDALFFLVGNKIDLGQCSVIPTEAQKFAQSIDAGFMQVSAASGEGIREVFEDLVEMFCKLDDIDKKMYGPYVRHRSFAVKAQQFVDDIDKDNAKKAGCCGGTKKK